MYVFMYVICIVLRMSKLTYLIRVHINGKGQIGGCQSFLDAVRVFRYVYVCVCVCMCVCAFMILCVCVYIYIYIYIYIRVCLY
jgi:hypothetical protein